MGSASSPPDFWLEDESGRLLIKLGSDFDPVPLFNLELYGPFEEGDFRGREVVVCVGDEVTSWDNYSSIDGGRRTLSDSGLGGRLLRLGICEHANGLD